MLASASPRRRELLRLLGVEFDAVDPETYELEAGDPEAVVVENARRKARAGRGLRPEAGLVIGCDTEVVIDGLVLGKAADVATARERLDALSGRTHEVLGAVAASWADGAEKTGLERTAVTFVEVPGGLLAAYLDSGEWRDRAGAYAVQGLGSALVDRVEGELANVIGLPVGALLELAPELLDRQRRR